MRKKLCCIMSAVLALGICVPGRAMQALAADGGGQVSTSATAPQGPAASGQAADESQVTSAVAREQGEQGAASDPGKASQAVPAPADEPTAAGESQANGTRGSPTEEPPADVPAAAKAPLRAPAAAKQVDATVTKFDIQDWSHNTATQLHETSHFYLAMDWDASANGTDIHEGDYFDITLPDNMRFPDSSPAADFNLTDADGNVVATAHVTPGPGGDNHDAGGTVRVTFTEGAESKYNVKGTIHLSAHFERSKIKTGEDNTFTVTVNGEVSGHGSSATVGIIGQQDLPDEVLGKWGGEVSGDKHQAMWHVRINHNKSNLTNVVVTDELQGGTETYIPSSFKLDRVDFTSKGYVNHVYETVDTSSMLAISPDGHSFTLNLGNVPGDQYRLTYASTYTPGSTLKNKLKLTSTEQSKVAESNYHSSDSGGTAGGDLASKIKLVKVAADDTSVVLAGAVFTVTRPDGSTFELTTGADGTVTSGHLEQGTYKAKEKTAPTGYELNEQEYTLTVNSAGGALQTITDEPVRTSVDVTKSWVGPEGGDVTVRLLADNTDTGKTATLSAAGGWTGSFDGLRKFDVNDGHEIVYTVSEDPVANYDSTVSGDAASGFTITNTNAETVSVSGTKTWDDANDQDGRRPASITVNLMKDGVKVDSKTVTAADGWSYSFAGLAKYDPADGHEYAYAVAEDAVAGYTATSNGYNLTNTHAPETTSVPVTKAWVGPKGSQVTVRLLADGAATGKTVTLSDGNNWTASFENLPKYRDHGTEIAYTVSEEVVDGYSSSISGDAASGFTITNTNTEKVGVSGTKTWDDDGNRDGKRPDSITVRLLADGVERAAKTVTSDDGWAWSFDGLNKYDQADGHEISYPVTEDAVPGYATTVDGFDVTNSRTPGKTSVTVTKAWDDGGDQDGVRPGTVKVQLYANGTASGDPVTLDEGNQWTHTWTGLFQKEGGQDVVYTVGELDAPAGYTSAVSGDATAGFTVTNAHAPEVVGVPVAKVWVGGEAGPVTIHLLADGVDTGNTLTLTADGDWKGSFEGLPKYKDHGTEIAYTISEDAVSGYTSQISGDAKGGFTVTNTKDEIPGKPGGPSQGKHGGDSFLPKTGDDTVAPIALLAAALAAGAAGLIARRRMTAEPDDSAAGRARHSKR